jgi:cold shock CspA family protein
LINQQCQPGGIRVPEPTQHEQTNIDAKADEPQLGRVVSYNGRFAFIRPDNGTSDVYVGLPQLLKARIEYLPIGSRVCFQARQATDGRRPWAIRIRLASEAPA